MGALRLQPEGQEGQRRGASPRLFKGAGAAFEAGLGLVKLQDRAPNLCWHRCAVRAQVQLASHNDDRDLSGTGIHPRRRRAVAFLTGWVSAAPARQSALALAANRLAAS